jgi:hypothetical protein
VSDTGVFLLASDFQFALYRLVNGQPASVPEWLGGCNQDFEVSDELSEFREAWRHGQADRDVIHEDEEHVFSLNSVWVYRVDGASVTVPRIERHTQYVLVCLWRDVSAKPSTWVKRTYWKATWRSGRLRAALDGEGREAGFVEAMVLRSGVAPFETSGVGTTPTLDPERWGEIVYVDETQTVPLYKMDFASGTLAAINALAGTSVVYAAGTLTMTLEGVVRLTSDGTVTLVNDLVEDSPGLAPYPRLEFVAGGQLVAALCAEGLWSTLFVEAALPVRGDDFDWPGRLSLAPGVSTSAAWELGTL